MVDSANTLSPLRRPASETFAAQLALARIHPNLVPLSEPLNVGALDAEASTWFRLPDGRGFESFGLARALRILLDVLAGLSALHDTQTSTGADFVHGELVPEAVRIDLQGVARVLPLAPWHLESAGSELPTRSLGHLAPERLLGDTVDRRADIFSAGVFLWEALAGRRLFTHDSVDGIITQLMGGKVLLPELPPELSWAAPLKVVAMRALAIDSEQRFADCSQLASAVEGVAHGHLAEHNDVATFFGAPFFGAPLRARQPIETTYRSATHQSSLSAMVTVTSSVLPVPASTPVLRPRERRTQRLAWAVFAFVTAAVALGLFAGARQKLAVSPVSAAPAPATAEAADHGSAFPELLSAPAPVPTTQAAEVPREPPLPSKVAPARTSGPAVSPSSRESRARALPKLSKPASPKQPRSAPTDEQYGI